MRSIQEKDAVYSITLKENIIAVNKTYAYFTSFIYFEEWDDLRIFSKKKLGQHKDVVDWQNVLGSLYGSIRINLIICTSNYSIVESVILCELSIVERKSWTNLDRAIEVIPAMCSLRFRQRSDLTDWISIYWKISPWGPVVTDRSAIIKFYSLRVESKVETWNNVLYVWKSGLLLSCVCTREWMQ